jgi:signal transduction histidine kinase
VRPSAAMVGRADHPVRSPARVAPVGDRKRSSSSWCSACSPEPALAFRWPAGYRAPRDGPIAELTAAAAEIARTGDPSAAPQPRPTTRSPSCAHAADDAHELDDARARRPSDARAPARFRRRRLARAAHTADERAREPRAARRIGLHGEEGEIARSALRSTQRMRRLVADLLLLARYRRATRVNPDQACDLAEIVIEAAAELGPVSFRRSRDRRLDVQPAHRVAAPRRAPPPRDQPARERDPSHAARHHIRASTRTIEDGRRRACRRG